MAGQQSVVVAVVAPLVIHVTDAGFGCRPVMKERTAFVGRRPVMK